MCAMLAILVPGELGLRKAAIRRCVEAYIGKYKCSVETGGLHLISASELLSRLRQHILAAHVRKYTEMNLTEQTGQVWFNIVLIHPIEPKTGYHIFRVWEV